MTDRKLIEQFVTSGDQRAFEELIRRHVDMIYGVARRRAPSEADDVTQATFLLLAKKARALRDRESVAGWLFGVAQHCCRNALKQARRRVYHESIAGKEQMNTYIDGPAAIVSVELVDRAVEKLPRKYREAVLLRYLEGRSPEETAALLGVTKAAAVKRAGRGVEMLRKAFARSGYSVSAAGLIAMFATESAKAAPLHVASGAAGVTTAAVSGKAALLAAAAGKGLTAAFTFKLAGIAAAALVVATTTVAMIQIINRHTSNRTKEQPQTALIAAPAAEADESTVEGNVHVATFDLVLRADAAEELRNLTTSEKSEGTFFEVRRGKAAAIRNKLHEVLKDPTRGAAEIQLMVAALSPQASPQGADLFSGWGNVYMSNIAIGDNGKFGYSINFSGPWLKGAAKDSAAELRINFDNISAALSDNAAPASDPNLNKNKMAAVHWSGKLLSGETVVMMGDWGEWNGRHVVSVRVLETFKATATQRNHIAIIDAAAWIENGPARLRALADSARVWAAAGEKTWLDGREKWTRGLPDGTVVRLLAVARPMQFPFCWWTPDGVPSCPRAPTGTVLQMRVPFGVVVQVLRPTEVFQSDSLGWFTGSGIRLEESDRSLQIFVATGEWKRQEIQIGETVPLNGGNFQLARVRSGGMQVWPTLRMTPTPELQVNVAAVTRDGRTVPMQVMDDDIVTQSSHSEKLRAPYGSVLASLADIDHWVLCTRPREVVTFENFSPMPTVEPKANVTADELKEAETAIARMTATEEELQWKETWVLKEQEYKKLAEFPRDEKTRLGAMRMLVDKAQEGDVQGIKRFLKGSDPALVDAYAACLAGYGKIYQQSEKHFGREELMKAFTHSRFRHWLALEPNCLNPEIYAPVERPGQRGWAPLVEVEGRWCIDVDRVGGTFTAKRLKEECDKMIEGARLYETDFAAGRIGDANAAVTRLFNLQMPTPPLLATGLPR